MRWQFLGLCLITSLVLAACGGDAAEPSDTDGTAESIRRFLGETLPSGASGSYLAAHGGEMVSCEGFGESDREKGIAADCDTAYDLMSMTKQFTAAAILKLQMMGKLDVRDPISDYIRPVPPDKRAITLHQLLTHTSGLTGSLGGDYEPLSRDHLVARALHSRLRAVPGEDHHYSNVGYSLLGAIIEEASGMGYEEFLGEHLFAPAGMTQTGYVLPEWEPERVAIEYDAEGEPQGRPFDHPWADNGPYWNLHANGGMLSTARDMFRWHLALEGDEVLDEASKDLLFEPHVLEEEGGDSYYGYGWAILPETKVGTIATHDGGNGWSFGIVTRILDNGTTVFWVTNGYKDSKAGWNLYRLAQKITEGLAVRVASSD
ncbi:MAG TPA: serine hydrolase domain-containing protein [Solirubrobacterales bacterium]|nr:serine hydrolase domain-containing protein [Solirubrobacterales bacterium]